MHMARQNHASVEGVGCLTRKWTVELALGHINPFLSA